MDNENKQSGNFAQLVKNTQLTAIAAGFVSLVALGVSIYEAYINRQQQRISVLPILDMWTSYDVESYQINVANKGTGPAHIKAVRLSRGNQSYHDWFEIYQPIMGEQARIYGQAMLSGGFMGQGETVSLLNYATEAQALAAHNIESEISLEICYCSIFKECYLISYAGLSGIGGQATEPVNECIINPDNRF